MIKGRVMHRKSAAVLISRPGLGSRGPAQRFGPVLRRAAEIVLRTLCIFYSLGGKGVAT